MADEMTGATPLALGKGHELGGRQKKPILLNTCQTADSAIIQSAADKKKTLLQGHSFYEVFS